MIEQPLLAEETHSILHRILDKADAGKMRLQLKCGPKETPELYDFADQDMVHAVWDDLKLLAQLGILDLKLKRVRSGQNEYDDGRIDLIYEAEGVVRKWLQRPGFDPQYHLWSKALDKFSMVYEDQGDALKQTVLTFPGKSYGQLAQAFARIAEVLTEPMTLRQLSAKCFWGNSKYLDRAEGLIRATFPSQFHHLLPRPVLLPVSLPVVFDKVLFVENQDTFLALVAKEIPGMALINMGGFRGTAQRVREPGQAVFAFVGEPADALKLMFESFWLGQNPLPVFFWGDLDFAGLKILAALNMVFPGVQAWQPGYRPMLEALENGFGHIPAAAKKERQVRPGVIGCDYADYVLLPAIEQQQGFIDQEWVSVNQLDLREPVDWTESQLEQSGG